MENTYQAPFSAKLLNKPPRKPKNLDRRTREYLTQDEINNLRKAAKSSGRHGHRDDTLILLMFRHGFRAGEEAAFGFTIHPHMLRHSTGFYLANQGHDTRAIQSYLGHANIKNTVIYTELAPNRFKGFWKD